MSHTPEPWSMHPATTGRRGDYRLMSGDLLVGRIYADRGRDARRIVACVNACKDWTTEALEMIAGESVSVTSLDLDLIRRLPSRFTTGSDNTTETEGNMSERTAT